MDEYEDHEFDREAHAEPPTERVRIIGAEQAGVPPEPDPDDGIEEVQARYLGFSAPSVEVVAPEEAETLEPLAPPELPHWTDPPTGQVPAVLDRRPEPEVDDDEGRAWAALVDSGPVWREHHHEWEDTGFEPSLLADDETRVGALEETPVEERRPWEFDDLELTRQVEIAEGPTPEDDEALDSVEDTIAWPADRTVMVEAPEADSGASWDDVVRPPITEDDEEFPPATAASTAPKPPPRYVGRRRASERADEGGDGSRRNVPVAIATGIAVAAVALACFKLGPLATVVLATVVVTLAAAECYAAVRRVGMRPATLLGLVATVAVMVSAYSKGVAAIPLVLVLVVVTSMVWYLVGAERGAPVEGISATVLTFAWVSMLGAFAALMVAPSIYPHRHGVAFLFGAVVATVGADVGALAVGAWIGRHQLAPHVSPNKTWEGFFGGVVLSVAASIAITGQMHPWTPAKAAVLGVVVAFLAPIGDLCESLVKRDLGLKDMGSILPGHGGVLDRVDALLFVLPATYYLVRLLNLG